MGNFEALLLQNGIFASAALLVMLLSTVAVTLAISRLGQAFLSSRIFENSAELKASFSRRLWRTSFFVLFLAGLLIAAGLLLATHRKIRLGELTRSSLAQVQPNDWVVLGVAAGKALGVLLLAFVAARTLVKGLQYVRERLQRAEVLVGHRERIAELLEHLRLALTTALLFWTLLFCADILGVSASARRALSALSYIGVSVFIARFLVGTAYLAIDVLFDLSDALSRLEGPLRYVGRFHHLSKLTKRTADYFIYVGIATWTIEQITPGTWATQTGRLALRIIAIFYLSRVLVEVCVLFMSEFFLTRAEKSAAEFQQRQTLVPVAAGLLRYGIYFAAVVMSLREAGIDPTPLLAGAGVAGVAVGLGAQSFVGDLVAGFFILFENLFLVGDFVQIGEVKGKVEEIGVRVTKIRDEAGVLHAIPNGEVRKVSSHSRGYVNAVVDVLIPYGENLHRVFDVLRKKAAELRESHPDIMSPMELGLEEMGPSAVKLRTVTMVKPGTTKEMEDVLKLAFWDALVAARITPPHARQLILSEAPLSEAASAPEPARTERTSRTDIQRLKAYNLYLAMDVDDNGFLEQADVDVLGRRLVENQQRGQDTTLVLELRRRLEAYWQQLVGLVDSDRDGRVSREEFLEFCAVVTRDFTGPAGESVQALSDVLFTVCDRNGNDALSEAEFLQWGRSYGFSDSVAIAGFNLIDRDRNSRITREEWLRFMRDVFVSKKLNDASAVVFGPGCRDRA